MPASPNSLQARDIAYHLHPMTNLKAHESVGPQVVARGEGVYVFDIDGNRYLEGLAGLWCASLGFSEQRLVDAAARQMAELPYYHNFGHRTSRPVIALAEKLVSIAPAGLTKAFFASSGSEANESMIKIAWYYNNALGRPEKKKIFARRFGYHGVTLAAASLTGLAYMHDGFDLPRGFARHTETPHYWLLKQSGESEETFSDRLVAQLEAEILAEGPETVAAFIAEPVIGSGGVILPPATYFEKIQALLKRHDILFIADEVICGFGRTGSMFGSETYGLKPDMMTLAKGLSSGYQPISAGLVSQPIYEAVRDLSSRLGTFGTGFTYGGHPVCAAVALETLAIYEERGIVDEVRRKAVGFAERLAVLSSKPIVGEARGVGLLGAVQLARRHGEPDLFDPAEKLAPWIMGRAAEHGLFVRVMRGESIAICPPLIITDGELDELFDKLGRTLDDVADEATRRGLLRT